jgi:bifunctional non-homologous end joining protein LigD
MLPQISPSPLTSLNEPIGHPNWIYEVKHDGFRGILYVDREQAWLVSRKGNKFRQFDPLLKQVLRSLKGKRAILDGEIVVLDEKARSNFYDLMAHRGEPRYYAFDLLWLNGIDLRSRPLLDRKRTLRQLIPANDSHLLYVEHLDGDGQRFFELACEQDLEGIICKPKTSPYPFTWIKVKNPNYSQAEGRREWFDRMLSRR